ncbi:AbiH family protein, partial [Flavobacterium sp.]|uniref:AbiH family protein n=1 Tax=Flavobacterium sp. TaxID=239 RepID=UPI002FDE1683
FRIICDKIEVENWVDIENIYYDILKDKGVSKVEALKYPHSIEKLNEEFHDIKELLEVYLTNNIKNKYHFNVEGKNEILNLFYPEIIFPDGEEYFNFLNQFPSSKHNYIKEYLKIFNIDSRFNQMDRFIEKGYNDEVLILDFNYTPTTNYYLDKMYDYFFNPQLIKIHGELKNNNNPINFGFGDEYDDDYKSIENINKNEYLKNIKSFKYSNNTNYRKLMNFVFKKEFQVYILGHSCGLSDRTLLQSIFEHSNCLSIKPIYYLNEKGEDNYSDMVYNISRNFKNKIMMRDKIVDKTLTSILVQNVRFKEK